MDRGDYYRRLADEALQLSRSAGNPVAQATIEEIAYTWSRLAREQRTERLALLALQDERPQAS